MASKLNTQSRRTVSNWTLCAIASLVMVGGGLAHLLSPQGFAPLVPSFLPATPVILLTGGLQILIGLTVLWPRTRAWGGLAFALLCTAYLPLHLWDFIRPDPVFAPPLAALARTLTQCLFIWAGYALWRSQAKR